MNSKKRINFQEIAEKIDSIIDMAEHRSLTCLEVLSGIVQSNKD